jgi:hypothetical protein
LPRALAGASAHANGERDLFSVSGIAAQAAGTYMTLHQFTGGNEGATSTPVTLDGTGNVYGGTTDGGNICPDGAISGVNQGCGTLYKIRLCDDRRHDDRQRVRVGFPLRDSERAIG